MSFDTHTIVSRIDYSFRVASCGRPGHSVQSRTEKDRSNTTLGLVCAPIRELLRRLAGSARTPPSTAGAQLIGLPDGVTLALLAFVTLGAAALQGAVGFGFGLLALPLYMWIIGSVDAVSLVIVINLTICVALSLRIRGEIERSLLFRMAGGALIGFPLGLAAFARANVDQLMITASVVVLTVVVLLAFAGPRLAGSDQSASDRLRFSTPSSVGVGMLAGGMTMALGLPGPPVVLYMVALRPGKDVLRATVLAFFSVSYAGSLLLQTVTVGVERGVWVTAGLMLPAACAGGAIGNWLARFVGETAFRRVVLGLIALAGVSTLVSTIMP